MLIHGVDLIERDDMVIAHQRRTRRPFEAASVAAWCEAAGGVMVDVGAYTGLYAILAAQRGAVVHAFEPNPAAYRRLLENIARNGVTVNACPVAVGDHAGRAALQVNPGVRITSGGRLVAGDAVEVVTIDSLGLSDVAAIKIDVEGAECRVLAGALETIARCRPLLITEALSQDALKAQAAVLRPLGYAPARVDEWNVVWRA
mgnify:CR=1 FL=1